MTGILFDLDGTLLDTLDDLTASVNYSMNCFACPCRTREEVRRFVGNGAYELIRLSVSAQIDAAAVLPVFQEHYKAHCEDATKPYAGIAQMLSAVSSRYPTAIVSNKPDAAVKKLCSRFFPGIPAKGQSDSCPRKPAPDMLLQAMKQIGADSCIYVGDSEVDVLTAANADVPCISVLWGFRDEPELSRAGARYFCERPDDIISMIDKILKGAEHGK